MLDDQLLKSDSSESGGAPLEVEVRSGGIYSGISQVGETVLHGARILRINFTYMHFTYGVHIQFKLLDLFASVATASYLTSFGGWIHYCICGGGLRDSTTWVRGV